ncbi:hypothetical protein FACS1894216_12870 [Synergistales bacterium]|nr:hypothetical protein FACS1894216_12870 [Synergistales bacterium]
MSISESNKIPAESLRRKTDSRAVSAVDEGIEPLTGVRAGSRPKSGAYPKDSVRGETKTCLRGWLERAAKLKAQISKPPKPKKTAKK